MIKNISYLFQIKSYMRDFQLSDYFMDMRYSATKRNIS